MVHGIACLTYRLHGVHCNAERNGCAALCIHSVRVRGCVCLCGCMCVGVCMCVLDKHYKVITNISLLI